MKNRSPSSGERWTLHVSARAQRTIDQAGQWWVETHGPLAPSPLAAELVEAFEKLRAFPYLGYERWWRRKLVRTMPLRCAFHVVYRCRPRLRVVEIDSVVAGSRLYR